ncbi:hypothetical protein FACS1894130_12620 [Spirochaetia bacterium]|nr:hypothetical protein FACS1894130_12620 [Spirochaetia bacterium]
MYIRPYILLCALIFFVCMQNVTGLDRGDPEMPFTFAYSPDGTYIAVGAVGGTIKILDTALTEIRVYSGHTSSLEQLVFSPDGKYLASCSDDIIVFDVETGNKTLVLSEHDYLVTSISYRFDGERLVSGSTDGTIKIWDTKSGKAIKTITVIQTPESFNVIKKIAYTADGSKIISVCEQYVTIWDADTGEELHSFTDPNLHISSAAYSNDGKKIIVCYVNLVPRIKIPWFNTDIRIYDAESYEVLFSFSIGQWSVRSVIYSPTDRYIIISSDGNSISSYRLLFINSQNGGVINTIRDGVNFSLARNSFAVSRDERHLVNSSGKEIKIWEIE